MARRGFRFQTRCFDTRFILDGPKIAQYLRYGSLRLRALNSLRDSILFTWPVDKRKLQALVTRNVALVESVLEVTGKTVFVDTSKDPLRLKSLHRLSNLDVRAIHLVRDIRGVAASQLRRDAVSTASQAARQWVRLHRRLEDNLALLPRDKTTTLRYEDLCHNARGTTEQLYAFCSVATAASFPDVRTNAHHIVGNPMRLQPVSEIRLDERWKQELSEDQLHEIEEIAGKVGRRHGYF
jgi:hypothetical protein